MRRIVTALLLSLLSVPAFAAMQAKPVAWKVGKQAFSGVLVYDDASRDPRPGLVMVPDWYGVTPAAIDKAKQVADDDYVILVVDMYGKKVRPKDDKAALAQVKKLYADIPTLRARIAQAVEVLKSQAGKAPLDANRIGAFGYCFGGATVLELARSGAQLAGIVTFHGGLQAYGPKTESVKTPLLVLNGAADESTAPYVADFEKEMTAAGADWQFVNFSGAVHCFALETANKPGCMYDARAAKRAYRMMDDFFEERFGD
ncbi:dienelactone hydrolase family protein [Luteimonas aquatica]|uniref:dienelactone hydrolase family protein n=1 Tax=Luteimonas aquatica TaxID=450364 RepID=UPI001F55F8F7|nr:dienelactone hydrolase family protein [Luteimonas aquatica]